MLHKEPEMPIGNFLEMYPELCLRGLKEMVPLGFLKWLVTGATGNSSWVPRVLKDEFEVSAWKLANTLLRPGLECYLEDLTKDTTIDGGTCFFSPICFTSLPFFCLLPMIWWTLSWFIVFHEVTTPTAWMPVLWLDLMVQAMPTFVEAWAPMGSWAHLQQDTIELNMRGHGVMWAW